MTSTLHLLWLPAARRVDAGELIWSHDWDGVIAMPIFIAPDKLFVSTFQALMMAQLQ